MTHDLADFLIVQAILLPLLIGGIVATVWSTRRARRIRAEAEARGEPLPSRPGRRVLYVALGVVFVVIGFALLRH